MSPFVFHYKVCKCFFFFYGNKRDHRVRNTFGESMHRAKDISDMLGLECSLSAQIDTDRSNLFLRVIQSFHKLKSPGYLKS